MKEEQLGKIELSDRGFSVRHKGSFIDIDWEAIDKITGFLEDRVTYEDVWLRIETESNSVFASESFDGWPAFMVAFHQKFPFIDKNWTSQLPRPASERKESVLFLQ